MFGIRLRTFTKSNVHQKIIIKTDVIGALLPITLLTFYIDLVKTMKVEVLTKKFLLDFSQSGMETSGQRT